MKLGNVRSLTENVNKDAVWPILHSTEHLSSMPHVDNFGTSTK